MSKIAIIIIGVTWFITGLDYALLTPNEKSSCIPAIVITIIVVVCLILFN